jgi:glycosidase
MSAIFSLGTQAEAQITTAPVITSALPFTQGATEIRHPAWANHAVIYEVNIRQYTPEGTFKAFEAHLPRLRKMGVDILWIMPINPISQTMRKGTLGSYYAVHDYYAVNPEYGTLEDFQHLVQTAHQMGFKVILDWVANHTGWDHVWTTQHPDWYLRNAQGQLEGYHYTDLSDHHEETWADVIGLDYRKPEVRQGMIDAMSYWLRTADIDGFRCDVAWTLPVSFWDETRQALDRIKPVFMLAEADTPDMQFHAFDMTYDWTLYHLMIKIAHHTAPVADLAALYTQPARIYPAGAYRMTFTSDHDENSWNGTDRELYGEGFRAMAVLAMTLPGMGLVYSGQEAGLDKRLPFFEKDSIDWSHLTQAEFYRHLISLKHNHPALSNEISNGNLDLLHADSPQVFAFKRVSLKDQVQVVVNLSDQPVTTLIEGSTKPVQLRPWGFLISFPKL